MMPGGMQSASAMDLGLSSLKPNESEAEKLKRKKLMETQQQKIVSPFPGAYMSLNGNQF